MFPQVKTQLSLSLMMILVIGPHLTVAYSKYEKLEYQKMTHPNTQWPLFIVQYGGVIFFFCDFRKREHCYRLAIFL